MTGNELKEFMAARGLNNRQMGELIGYGEAAIRKACAMDEISTPMAKACEMAQTIEQQAQELAQIEQVKSGLSAVFSWVNGEK